MAAPCIDAEGMTITLVADTDIEFQPDCWNGESSDRTKSGGSVSWGTGEWMTEVRGGSSLSCASAPSLSLRRTCSLRVLGIWQQRPITCRTSETRRTHYIRFKIRYSDRSSDVSSPPKCYALRSGYTHLFGLGRLWAEFWNLLLAGMRPSVRRGRRSYNEARLAR